MTSIQVAVLILLIIVLIVFMKYTWSYVVIPDHVFDEATVLEHLKQASDMEAKLLCNRRKRCKGLVSYADGSWDLVDSAAKLKYHDDAKAMRRRRLKMDPAQFSHAKEHFTQIDSLDLKSITNPLYKRYTALQVKGPSHLVSKDGTVVPEGFVMRDTTDPAYRYWDKGGSVSGLDETFTVGQHGGTLGAKGTVFGKV